MKRVSEARLLEIAHAILAAEGCPPAEAEIVARHLVDANLKGHDSHGVGMLEHYVKNAKAGTLNPREHGRVISQAAPFLQIDGERGHGQVVARGATLRAIAATKHDGACILAIRNSHHMGRIGTYGEMVVAEGLIGIFAVNVAGHRGLVAPHGGSDGRLGTNPVCIAVPGPSPETPFVLDMATSKVAVGKVRVSMAKGESMPENFLLDGEGMPTRDPGVMWAEPGGAVLPIGEHKGFGLGLAVDILAGALTGGGTLQPGNPRPGTITNNLFAIVIDPGRIADLDYFRAEIEAVLAYVKASPPRVPGVPVLTAGEPERSARADRLVNGVPLDDGTWASLVAAAAEVGITI